MLSSLTTGSCVPLGRLRERRISWITAAREPSGPWSYGLSPNGRRQRPVPQAGWRQVQPRDDGALGGKGVAMKVADMVKEMKKSRKGRSNMGGC